MLWSVKLSLYKALPLEYLEVFAYQNTLTQGYQNLGSLENRSHVIQQCSVVISEYFFQESADLPQGIRIFGCVSSVFTKEVVSLHLKFELKLVATIFFFLDLNKSADEYLDALVCFRFSSCFLVHLQRLHCPFSFSLSCYYIVLSQSWLTALYIGKIIKAKLLNW